MSDTIVQDYWNERAVVRREAARSGAITFAERLAWRDVLRRHLDSAGKMVRILDVGCGCGVLPAIFVGRQYKYTGVDRSSGLLDVARQRAEEAGYAAQFVESDVNKLDFPNAAFDAVIALNVLSLMARPRVALTEWARVLKPGGRLIVVEDDYASADFPPYQQHQIRTSDSPFEQAYQQTIATRPLWQATAGEIEKVMRLDDHWQTITQSAAMGQLLRKGRNGLTNYALGYQLITATKGGSISL
ncbi:MAG TPA: class I SAM-dependent methyltransferase [Anaerolineae bacterium]|nr:class I SAM-dependent methyltransferase [Anaerolineae bacterium]